MTKPDDLVARLRAIADMAAEAINTGGRIDFDPRGVEDDLRLASDRIEALEAALRPFADVGELFELETEGFADTDELPLMTNGEEFRLHTIKFGDFRRALTAMQGERSSA